MRERREIGLERLDLTGVRTAPKGRKPTAEEVASRSGMPSREAEPPKEHRVQCNMSLPASLKTRFETACRDSGKSKPALLAIMLDIWDKQQ